MRSRSLLILALVVGVLLALIYFAEDRVAGTDERAAAARRLVGTTPEEVVALVRFPVFAREKQENVG